MSHTIEMFVGRESWMSANQRLHWGDRKRRTERLRTDAGWLIRAAGVPKMKRVQITAHVHYPKGTGRCDPANSYPTIKAIVDAIVDVGILPDDDHTRVIGPDMRRGDNLDVSKVWKVVLTIEELEN